MKETNRNLHVWTIKLNRYDNGRIIFRQGDSPERFYFILAGKG